ncbi:MAG: UbiA family prenyltransferase [Actinomycetota bacterium]|nr:UbiA family prenyltransferase [Actinomycetota bacterium]
MLYRCFLEARPAVQGMFLVRFLAGASFAGPLFTEGINFPLRVGATLWICATLSVYILNGVMDVEEDRTNNSSRPIASGKLPVAQAAGVTGGLAVLSVIGSFALGSTMVGSVVMLLILGWLYSGPPLYLKRWPTGSAAVAILAALITYNAGYTAHGDGSDAHALVVFAVVMALWMGLVGQTKDLSDVEGDKQAGRRSGPVIWGEDVARVAFSGVALSIGGVYILAAALFATSLLIPAFVLASGAIAVALVTLGPWSRGDKSRRRRPYKAFMHTQYVATLAVVVW